MDRHKLRGTKRRCQNDDCALPFYDLNRTEIQCPNCSSAFVVQVVPAESERRLTRPYSKRPQWPTTVHEKDPVVENVDSVEAVQEAELQDSAGASELLEVEEDSEDVIVEPLSEATPDE